MKQTFYFQHDNNAYADEKIVDLRMKHGAAGYGAYWAILEQLHQNNGKMQLDSKRLAFALQLDANLVESIIKDFDLFVIENNIFYNKRLLEHFEKRKQISEIRAIVGKKGGSKSRGNEAIGKQLLSKNKQRKGKERKGKENNTIPFNNSLEKYIETFNEYFGGNYRLTTGRDKKLKTRLETYTLEQILEALKNLSASAFHTGKNESGWKADPDFLIRNDEQIDKWLNQRPNKKVRKKIIIKLPGE